MVMTAHERWLIDLRTQARTAAQSLTKVDVSRLHVTIAKNVYMSDPQQAQAGLGPYSMTQGDVINLLVVQNSYCACCKQDLAGPSVKRWAIDHNRQNRKVRGILCTRCNTSLLAVWLMKAMISYLQANGDWDA